MRIKIKEKELELKYTFRAMLIYEKITDKSFMPSGLYDVVMFFYATVLASDKDFILSFDDFIDYLDENPTAVGEFSDWLMASIDKQNKLSASLNKKNVDEKKKEENKKKLKTMKTTD